MQCWLGFSIQVGISMNTRVVKQEYQTVSKNGEAIPLFFVGLPDRICGLFRNTISRGFPQNNDWFAFLPPSTCGVFLDRKQLL